MLCPVWEVMWPMYVKLSLRNLRRSISDYFIYVVTLILCFSMIFAYNALIFSDPVRLLAQNLNTIFTMILMVTLVIILILGWLIAYIVGFIFNQRSREFACYMTLGMETKNISRMFSMEQLFIGLITFLIGILLGNVIYYGLCQIIFHTFETSLPIDLSYLLPAFFLTLGCFLVMFAAVLFFQNRNLKKVSVTELLDFNRQHETIPPQKKSRHLQRIIAFILCAPAGFALLLLSMYGIIDMSFASVAMFTGMVLQIASILLFYREVSTLIYSYYEKNPKKNYRGERLYFYRQLTSQLSHNGRRLGILALLAFIAILGFCGAFISTSAMETSLKESTPFSIGFQQLYNDDHPEYTLETRGFEDIITRYSPITGSRLYTLYQFPESFILEEMGLYDGAAVKAEDIAMKLSDYNALRTMLGYEPVSLAPGTYIAHCLNDEMRNTALHVRPTLSLNGQTYAFAAAYDEYFSVSDLTGYGGLIVLEDHVLEGMVPYFYCAAYMTKDPLPQECADAVSAHIEALEAQDPDLPYLRFSERESTIMGTRTSNMFLVLLAAYTSLICLFIIGTVLCVQQLFESRKCRHQYELLLHMGADRSDLKKGIRKELALYFLLPTVIPLIYSGIYLWVVFNTKLFAPKDVWFGVIIALLATALVYGIYYVIAVTQYQTYVLREPRYQVGDL